MFINKDVAVDRLDSESNLINLVINSSHASRFIPAINENEFPIEVEIVSEDEGRETSNLISAIVKPHHSGRNTGGIEVPMELRHAAALLAQVDSIKNVAESLGLNFNTVAQAKHGRSTFGKKNDELKARLDDSLSTVRDRAMDRLLSSLNLLDDEKMEKCNAKDISAISGNMAKVMAMTLPKDAEQNIHAQLIVYAPTQVNESRFEVVEI
jgi:hypothetical protein